MSPEYRSAVNRYLRGLGAVCLIVLPFVGIGAIVIWVLTAATLHAFVPSSEPNPPDDPGTAKRRRKCRRRR